MSFYKSKKKYTLKEIITHAENGTLPRDLFIRGWGLDWDDIKNIKFLKLREILSGYEECSLEDATFPQYYHLFIKYGSNRYKLKELYELMESKRPLFPFDDVDEKEFKLAWYILRFIVHARIKKNDKNKVNIPFGVPLKGLDFS